MTDFSMNAAPDQLRTIAERWERLEAEKQEAMDAIKNLKAEAKANGFDLPTLTWAMKERKMELADRQERDAMRDLYAPVLGLTYGGQGE